jgi:CBS domain-containing protein
MNEFSAEHSSMTYLLMCPTKKLADSNVTMADHNDSADAAIRLMKEKQTKCVLLSKGKEVIGIVTKTDILYKVLSQGKNPSKVRLEEIMTSPILAVDPESTVQEALSIMDKHSIRQIVVSSNSSVIGIISRDDLFERERLATTLAEESAIQGTPVCIINPDAIVFGKESEA